MQNEDWIFLRVLDVLTPGVYRPGSGRKADHSPPSSAEVKKE
jgi:hypothetical protein